MSKYVGDTHVALFVDSGWANTRGEFPNWQNTAEPRKISGPKIITLVPPNIVPDLGKTLTEAAKKIKLTEIIG